MFNKLERMFFIIIIIIIIIFLGHSMLAIYF